MTTFLVYYLGGLGIFAGFAILCMFAGENFDANPCSALGALSGLFIMLVSFSPMVYEFPSFSNFQYSYVLETTDDGEIIKHAYGTWNLEGTGDLRKVTYSVNTYHH